MSQFPILGLLRTRHMALHYCPRFARGAGHYLSKRSFTTRIAIRPSLPFPQMSSQVTVPPNTKSPAGSSQSLDLLPKISAHPALAGIQVRNGPRDTYDPSHRVRKRRHGFLSRVRTRKGRKILKKRKAKGRSTLSH
ncbi:MAG: hypothetical protein L6R36_005111 [Xanthoria steineri]|nr:MAG: hypothetical protein L6R36_005111 [Xanthoria steineri]